VQLDWTTVEATEGTRTHLAPLHFAGLSCENCGSVDPPTNAEESAFIGG